MRKLHMVLYVCLALLGGQAFAQESLRIGPGDLLHVSVFREPDFEQRPRVEDSGDVSLDLIGRLHVAGLTPAAAAHAIEARYLGAGILNHPQVSITVEQYATQSVAVLGQVGRPGMLPITTPLSLLDVLSMAGGLNETADRHVTIEHAAGSTASQPASVFVGNSAEAQVAAAKVMVAPGDKVIVPRAGIVYVLGDVGRPGGYVMQNDARLTALEALALAAGAQKTAAEQQAVLLHREGGTVIQRRLPLRDIERGKLPDVTLAPNDVVYVPFSMMRNIALGSTAILSSASTAIIYSKP